jgi:hypothetical protein
MGEKLVESPILVEDSVPALGDPAENQPMAGQEGKGKTPLISAPNRSPSNSSPLGRVEESRAAKAKGTGKLTTAASATGAKRDDIGSRSRRSEITCSSQVFSGVCRNKSSQPAGFTLDDPLQPDLYKLNQIQYY